MDKVRKQAVLGEMRSYLAETKALFLLENKGMKVEELTDLRRQVRKANGKISVVKNTLMNMAVDGTGMKELSPLLFGPVAIAYTSNDPVEVTKTLLKFCKENEKVAIKGGFLSGKVLNLKEIEVLGTLPSLDQLRAKFLSVLNGVPQKFVSLLNAVPGGFVNVLDARKKSLEG